MIDSRLTQMRECLAPAMLAAGTQARWLLHDTTALIDELADEDLTIHEAIDVAQIRVLVSAAQRSLTHAETLMAEAVAEIKTLEEFFDYAKAGTGE